ncbi:MAG TPA: DinB family protein [Blastocatellia bacterium]|nr:DinB family protein [Blastocatellia bacterium]
MESGNNLSVVALEAVRSRITRILPAQIRSCVEELSEEQLWWRPNEQANSVGNLVLHMSGSMRHYLSNRVGGIQYERDRPAEFAERGPVPKQQLLETFDETIRQAAQILDSFDTSRFLDATDEPNYVPTVFDLIFNIAIHLATHAGQIVYVTKALKEGSVDELWIHAHKSGGGSVAR